MQTCGRGSNGTLIAGKDRLEVLHIIGIGGTAVDDVAGQWGLTQGKELAFELLVLTVVEEAQRTSAAGGIVDDLSHHRAVLFEEELIADTYLAGWLDEHIPQAQFLVEFAQQEHLYLGVGLLLRAVETGGEHLGVVEDEGIALVEVVHQVAECQELVGIVAVSIFPEHLYRLTLAVNHHQSRLVTTENALFRTVLILKGAVRRIKGYLLFGQLESEL